jgi:DNA-binding transcriptional LysR family regulator
VSDALRQLEASIAPRDFSPDRAGNAFTLAMADATAAEVVPGLVEILERDAPGISIRMVPLTTRDPRSLLEEGTVDLALGFFPAVLADLTAQVQGGSLAAFEHQRLYDGQYVCVMREGHQLAGEPLTLDRFCEARHMLVSFSGRPFGFIDEALASLGRQRRVVLTVNQFFTAGLVVETSDLLTVLPRHFIRSTGRAEHLVQRDLPFEMPPVHVDALWHRHQTQRPEHAWLRVAVSTAARKGFGAGAASPLGV